MIDIKQLTQDAKNGDAEAQFKLGSLYYEGNIFAKDIEKGLFWLEKAAAAGNVSAMTNCHVHWTYDDEGNKHIGKLWAMAAAATGDSNSQYNYAVTLKSGDGGQADLRRAIRYYRSSARQGNADGLCSLATSFIEGKGVCQDVIKGIDYLNQALDQDNPVALYMAGLYLMNGDIVEQDIDLAHEFFVESSKQGLWLADEVLDDWDEYIETC